MSKIFIEFEKDNENNYKNIILREKSLFVNRKYTINDIDNLINDINNGKINIKEKKGKYIIDDICIVKKYSNIAKKLERKNRIYKRTKFASIAVASLLGSYIVLNNNKKTADPTPNIIESTELDYNKTTESNSIEEKKKEKDEVIIKTDNQEEVQKNVSDITEEIKTEENNEFNHQNNRTEAEVETYYFEAEDRYIDNDVVERFNIEDAVNYYSECYGICTDLMSATICQENMNGVINDSDVGAYGLTQIESVHEGETIYAYNFLNNSYDEETIDLEKVKYDNDYAVKISYMIYSGNYHYFKENYNYLSDKECILATMFCYNKGIGTVSDALDENDTFEGAIEQIKQNKDGDSNYINNVLRYLKNNTEISFKNLDETYSSMLINNTNVKTVEKYK